MGLAKGIFVVDTHVHAQRHAFKFKERGIKPDFATLADGMAGKEVDVYDNSERLLYHMNRYDVDMCVIMPAFGMTNEINAEIVKKYPDKFIAQCNAVKTIHKAIRGEEEWTIEAACKEIDELLSTGLYKGGIGEGFPRNPRPKKVMDWNERFEEICRLMELARKYKVPATFHTGTLSGYAGTGTLNHLDWGNPMLAHDVAAAYPDVPLILQHGGIQGWYTTRYYDMCLDVARAHPNVYLETGLYWAELYEKPLNDPNIGVEKLIWGTDWGASIPQQWMPGSSPQTYADQNTKLGPPAHQVDYYGWSLRELGKLNIPQDDLNLILGGNACRLFGIQPPHTRMFKQYLLR